MTIYRRTFERRYCIFQLYLNLNHCSVLLSIFKKVSSAISFPSWYDRYFLMLSPPMLHIVLQEAVKNVKTSYQLWITSLQACQTNISHPQTNVSPHLRLILKVAKCTEDINIADPAPNTQTVNRPQRPRLPPTPHQAHTPSARSKYILVSNN